MDSRKRNRILGKKITETRFDYGLTVSELAIMAMVTEEQLIEIESGLENDEFLNSEHCLDCVARLAKSLGVSKEFFLKPESHYIFTDEKEKSIQSSKNDLPLQDDVEDFIMIQRKIEFLKDLALPADDFQVLSNNAEEMLKVSDKNFKFVSVVVPVTLILFYLSTLALHLVTEKL